MNLQSTNFTSRYIPQENSSICGQQESLLPLCFKEQNVKQPKWLLVGEWTFCAVVFIKLSLSNEWELYLST
jgi:hypothetical protein